MMKIKNSLSTFLEQAMVMNNNSIETIDKISDAMSSSEDSVKLTLTDPNNPDSSAEYTIPSFGYLKSEIDRLSASINTMSNITEGSGSAVRLSDGSYRKIIASKIPTEAPTVTRVDGITTFGFKSNWFFEDMMNPSLYVTLDLSDQISADTDRIMIQRYILKCDTQGKLDLFSSKLNGRNDIDYKEFLTLVINNKISYTLDDEIKDLPPRSKRYFGTFSVIRIATEKDLSGNSVKRYVLDGLEFTDTRSGLENTRLLSVGDYVEINSNPTTTRYKVIYVDSSENKVGLKCVEGCEGVRIGADTLKISASQDTTVSADIPVGFDERQVIFVKAIDPDSNIPSNRWSPGTAFYTNELTYMDGNGVTQTLQKFYQKTVVDFGQVLLSYAQDYYPTVREGIVPNVPVLNYANGEGDFKIVQINSQLTESTDNTTFRSLVADKLRVQSELNNISSEISKQKELIQTTQYTSTNEKLKAQSTLNTLIDTQETLNSNYNSIVNNIKSKYESGTVSIPKYRVRGFWDIPESKMSSATGEQKIIKFKIRYRYLSESGNTNKEEEFTYVSGNSVVTGRFSNWNEIESKLRPRVKTSSGWEWEDIDTANPDDVNINQLDIPITYGEKVEIQVKSVSEAGWPSNPLESKWSDSIVVSFSDFAELQSDDISGLIDQNNVDAAVANVSKMFSSTTEHMSSSFYTNDKYFAHTAETITSGFLSEEQTPITLYDKLQDLQNQITSVIEQINGMSGDLNVVLVDNSDEEKTYTLNEGGTTYINAGNYLAEIAKLDTNKRNGAIITKTYYLDISTDAQSGLFLLSRLSGNRTSMCPNTITEVSSGNPEGGYETSSTGVKTYVGNDYESYDNIITPSTSSNTYYMEQGRYDLVPINLTNTGVLDFQIGSPSMYQSAQCKGQFVYSRFRDIGDTFDMYASGNSANFNYVDRYKDSEYEGYTISEKYYEDVQKELGESGDLDSFRNERIVSEYNDLTGSSVKVGDVGDSTLFKSVGETVLNRLPKTWKKPETASIRLWNNSRILTRADNAVKTGTVSSNNTVSGRLVKRVNGINSANRSIYTIIPKIQAAYGFADMKNSIDRFEEFDTDGDASFQTTHKIGYEDRDRYAIGENTCNSYLFLSPVNHNEIQVEGDTLNSTKGVKSGESLRVPIIYQFRMKDYDGNIFGKIAGDDGIKLIESSSDVKNTKFANIIGIDIWTGSNDLKPKQYDIIIYSTYGSTVDTNTSKTKTSTQTLTSTGINIVNKLDRLVNDNKTLTSKRTVSGSTTRLLK